VTLTRAASTVVLTSVQSGVGALTIRAVTGADVGDLRLACVYQLRSGPSSVVSDLSGQHVAPAGSRRPVIVAGRSTPDEITVDLRQVRDVQRFAVLAVSASGAALRWGGVLVVETTGGARIDVPLDHEPAAGIFVALSVTEVAGQLVLRAERELVAGTLRDACLAYGYERITWVDAATPLV